MTHMKKMLKLNMVLFISSNYSIWICWKSGQHLSSQGFQWMVCYLAHLQSIWLKAYFAQLLCRSAKHVIVDPRRCTFCSFCFCWFPRANWLMRSLRGFLSDRIQEECQFEPENNQKHTHLFLVGTFHSHLHLTWIIHCVSLKDFQI